MARLPDARTRTGVVSISRERFLDRYWEYEPGQHVTVVGSTGSGKTVLMRQLLAKTLRPDLQGVVLVMKPHDEEAARFVSMGMRRIRTWPTNSIDPDSTLRRAAGEGASRGWVLWPKLGDIEKDDDVLTEQFGKCFASLYSGARKRGWGDGRVIFADEIMGITELGLAKYTRAIWQRGRSMGLGLWVGAQRPAHVDLMAWQSPEHIFLAVDPDKRNRDRFKEIGGVDPDLIAAITDPGLIYDDDDGDGEWRPSQGRQIMGKYEFLYIRRSDRTLAIVEAR